MKTTLGVLGGGQLGRMLALAAADFGFRTRVYCPDPEACAGQVADHVCASWGDHRALREFAQSVDAVTFEFENIPLESVEIVREAAGGFHPSLRALAMKQDRRTEREFLRRLGIAMPRCLAVESEAEVARIEGEVGYPVVLKTCRFGYDGKGQRRAANEVEALAAFVELGGPLMAEEVVAFDREVSLVAAAGAGGERAFYPLVENVHEGGILVRTTAPASQVSAALEGGARRVVEAIFDELGYVGVLAVEFFQAGETLLVNELAPRVHNTGHWTIDGAATSQFSQHVRAVTGLPLGSCDLVRPSVMLNLIGGLPPLERMLARSEARVHLYGKEPRPGRKIGHVTLVGADGTSLASHPLRAEVDAARR